MNRREFIRISTGFTGYAVFCLNLPNVFLNYSFAEGQDIMKRMDDLFNALELNDTVEADSQVKKLLDEGHDAWEIHLLLFPIVQRVLNPPFINPHLPKMYAIIRELIPYLKREDIPMLIRLEVAEYTRRPKLEKMRKARLLNYSVSFKEIESAIRDQDWEKTATLMATFHAQAGEDELARRLLLLGSGYLSKTLGHSISCTVFILQEMSVRKGEDLWPVFVTLADYFCKGKFYQTPALVNSDVLTSPEYVFHLLLKTTKGKGIVNLHHTITLYAMEHVRYLFNEAEYRHMISALINFMGKKEGNQIKYDIPRSLQPTDYSMFYETFSGMDTMSLISMAMGMVTSSKGRRRLGRFLIKSVNDAYDGEYNPHYITGLGSALWAVDRYWNNESAGINALYQYLNFLFDGLKSTG